MSMALQNMTESHPPPPPPPHTHTHTYTKTHTHTHNIELCESLVKGFVLQTLSF